MKSVEQMLVLERITAVNERQTASTDDTMTLIFESELVLHKASVLSDRFCCC